MFKKNFTLRKIIFFLMFYFHRSKFSIFHSYQPIRENISFRIYMATICSKRLRPRIPLYFVGLRLLRFLKYSLIYSMYIPRGTLMRHSWHYTHPFPCTRLFPYSPHIREYSVFKSMNTDARNTFELQIR